VLNVAQRVDQAVDVSGNLTAGLKPGNGGKLLPNGEGSVGMEQQTDGGHADLGPFGNVSGQTDQQRMDLIFENHLQLIYRTLNVKRKTI